MALRPRLRRNGDFARVCNPGVFFEGCFGVLGGASPPGSPPKAPAFRGERGAPPGLAQWSRPPGRVAPAVAPWPSVFGLPLAGFGSQAICFGKLRFCAQGEAQSSIDSASQASLLEIEVYKCLFVKRGCRVSQRAKLPRNWRPRHELIVMAWALLVWRRHHSCVSV